MGRKDDYDAAHKDENRDTSWQEDVASFLFPVRAIAGALENDDARKGREDAREGTYNPPGDDGGCFLTTACVEHAGLPDDCDELTVLRDFRDRYVRALPEGPVLIRRYYAEAPYVVAAIKKSPDASVILDGILQSVRDVVAHIKRGDNEMAMIAYQHEFSAFRERFIG